MYRYILRESCSQFDSLPLTYLTIPLFALGHAIHSQLCTFTPRLIDTDDPAQGSARGQGGTSSRSSGRPRVEERLLAAGESLSIKKAQLTDSYIATLRGNKPVPQCTARAVAEQVRLCVSSASRRGTQRVSDADSRCFVLVPFRLSAFHFVDLAIHSSIYPSFLCARSQLARMKAWTEAREENIAAQQQQRVDLDQRQCTFHPKTNAPMSQADQIAAIQAHVSGDTGCVPRMHTCACTRCTAPSALARPSPHASPMCAMPSTPPQP